MARPVREARRRVERRMVKGVGECGGSDGDEASCSLERGMSLRLYRHRCSLPAGRSQDCVYLPARITQAW